MAHPTDVEQVNIEGLLGAYRELQSQFQRARDRLRRADEQKHTVNRRIFDRVRTEYDRELDAIRAQMSPLRDELDRLQATLEAQLREAEERLAAVEDEMAEIEFRHRVGEYGDGDFDTRRQTIDVRMNESRARQDELRFALGALDGMKDPDASGPDPAGEIDRSTLAEAPGVPAVDDAPAAAPAQPPQPRPVLRAADATPAADRFENPQNWLDEIGRDLGHRDRRTSTAGAPAGSGADRARPVATETVVGTAPPARSRMPSLVFVRGAHAGQSIALLPTTLTVGREHDNNVEIKDAQVGRYHARIVHERGEYVVEDLDSSTGTWVNGQRVRRTVLKHGDVIRVGQTELALDFEWTESSG